MVRMVFQVFQIFQASSNCELEPFTCTAKSISSQFLNCSMWGILALQYLITGQQVLLRPLYKLNLI